MKFLEDVSFCNLGFIAKQQYQTSEFLLSFNDPNFFLGASVRRQGVVLK